MAKLTLKMLTTTFEGFMEHDPTILSGVLKDEESLNNMEKELVKILLEDSKTGALSKNDFIILTDLVEDLEEIGDYCKDIIERVEIKIQENLLFSDDALEEYKHLYTVVESSLSDIVKALSMSDKKFASRVSADQEHLDELVEKYRKSHAERLMKGTCDLRAGNMFMNLLDFTAQIYHHTRAIARGILKIEL
ncbi:MAG: PhoU domain-containing protein [Candidatus Omnitrophota bacterium]